MTGVLGQARLLSSSIGLFQQHGDRRRRSEFGDPPQHAGDIADRLPVDHQDAVMRAKPGRTGLVAKRELQLAARRGGHHQQTVELRSRRRKPSVGGSLHHATKDRQARRWSPTAGETAAMASHAAAIAP
jgi:hypothetical protein